MKLIEVTVLIEAPGPFTEADAETFIQHMSYSLGDAIEAATLGVVDAAKQRGVPLADVARITVTS